MRIASDLVSSDSGISVFQPVAGVPSGNVKNTTRGILTLRMSKMQGFTPYLKAGGFPVRKMTILV